MEAIQSWLQSSRDWAKGVSLYMAYGSDLLFKRTLLLGKNEFAMARLVSELEKIAGHTGHAAVPAKPDADLLAAVTAEAHKKWKELANRRARLFGLCRSAPFEDENDPLRVQLHGELALDILQYHDKEVLPAYDQVDHVRLYGRLAPPPTVMAAAAESDALLVPDHLLKARIDNLRKNLSKMRKREATPERVQLIKEHEATLEKLVARWHSLK